MNEDGTFTLNNIGVQTLNLNVNGLPSGYYIKAINYGQQNAKENGLSYKGSNDVVDIVIRGKALKLKQSAQESVEIESIPAEDAPASAGF